MAFREEAPVAPRMLQRWICPAPALKEAKTTESHAPASGTLQMTRKEEQVDNLLIC